MFDLRRFTTFAGTAAAAAALGLAALASAGAAGASTVDDTFISVITDEGIAPPSEAEAITLAHGVCEVLDDGGEFLDAVDGVVDYTGLEQGDAGFFAGASIASYCPEYIELIDA